MNCLIDTGTQILRKSFYDKLVERKIDIRVIPIRKFTLVGAFAEKGELIANKTFVKFVLNGREFSHGLYLVKNLAYDMVLGLDYLSRNRAILRCNDNDFGVDFDEEVKVDNVAMNAIAIEDASARLERLLEKHERVFRDEIGRINNYEHVIRVTSRAPFKSKTYPIADVHREKVRDHLLDLEKADIVERTATQYINPLVVVVKKTGEIRLCLDAREINKRMENDHDQPPTIDEIFKRIGSRKFFSSLDVAKAFWQIPLREQDQKYTGFKFGNQTYVFK